MGRIEPLWREGPARLRKEVQMGTEYSGCIVSLNLKNGIANSGLHVCVILNKVNDVLHRCAGVTFNFDQEAYSYDFNGNRTYNMDETIY